jgi:hypothetical protein
MGRLLSDAAWSPDGIPGVARVQQVELELEGEYHIVEARNAIWTCGPFHVVAAP